jgi:hypothetical protein
MEVPSKYKESGNSVPRNEVYGVLWQNIDSFTDFAKYGYAAGNICLEKWGVEGCRAIWWLRSMDRQLHF